MINIRNRSDIESLRLECTECKAVRNMVTAFSENALSEYQCTCKHPHFKDSYARASFGCHEKMRVRLRSASGVYFPVTKAALLIPPWSEKVAGCIRRRYELLNLIGEDKLTSAVRTMLRDDLQDDTVSDDEIMRAWNVVRNSMGNKSSRTELSVLEDEYAVLSNDENDSDSFSSYSSAVPLKYAQLIDQLAVVDRLTVTQAFTGFTRITRNESNLVDISQYKKKWLPAVELVGEGIFIRFNKDMVSRWSRANASRYKRMRKAMDDSRFTFERFSDIYVMLHTFAHLFIREISDICGYSTASIREKIYSESDDKNNEVKMCGILVYVSSSDSDSSLGGLINIADDEDLFGRLIDSMLERASWCSADPLCISSMRQGYKNLNYASCHDCTLLPETSCERFNVFLDRASIVGTPDNHELGFFNIEGSR